MFGTCCHARVACFVRVFDNEERYPCACLFLGVLRLTLNLTKKVESVVLLNTLRRLSHAGENNSFRSEIKYRSPAAPLVSMQ